MIASAERPLMDSVQLPRLDALRGASLALVFVFHSFFGMMHPLFSPGRYHWKGFSLFLLRLSEPLSGGVEVFFVLSGFLISVSLLRQGDLNKKKILEFYIRRWSRIGPIYVLILGILLLAGISSLFLFLSLIFLANITPQLGVEMEWLPIWSISVEFQFYLVWPVLLLLLGKRKAFLLCLALILLSPCLRIWARWHGIETYAFSLFRLDGIACGCALAIFLFEKDKSQILALQKIWQFCLIVPLALAFIHPQLLFRTHFSGVVFSYQFWQILSVGLIGFSVGGDFAPGFLDWRILQRFGVLSYGVFLIHPFLFVYGTSLTKYLEIEFLDTHIAYVILRSFCFFGLSLMLAAASERFIEKPSNRYLLSRLLTRKSKPISRYGIIGTSAPARSKLQGTLVCQSQNTISPVKMVNLDKIYK